MAFAINDNGHIFVGGLHTEGDILRFDESGAYVSTLGGTGEGPGEQGFVTHLSVGTGDTLYVIDEASRILNRFTASGEFVDKTLLPGGLTQALPLDGRRLLVSGALRTLEAAGFPLHVVDSAGIAASFGEELATVTPRTAGQLNRLLARAPNGGFWTSKSFEYTLKRWLAPSHPGAVLVRPAEWFSLPDDESAAAHPMRAPPQPRIHGMWDSGDGYLWVYGLVPDREWRPGHLEFDPATGMERLMEHSMDPFFDSLIEVIDLSRGAAIAHLRDERMLTPVGDGPFLYSYEEDSIGIPRYQLWRVSLSH